jgi:acetyl esterase/lipase
MRAAMLLSLLFAVAVFQSEIFAADPSLKNEQVIKVWNGTPPGSGDVQLTEKITDMSSDPKSPARVIENVQIPSFTVYISKKPNGAAAVVFPGGGYLSIQFDADGVETARWLNSIGITAFVLKGRLPGDGHLRGKDVPLQDAQRAMRLIRSNARKWGIDSARIGAVGIVSGGHQAAMVGTLFAKRVYLPRDDVDEYSSRPDWMILIAPEISGNARASLVRDQPSLLPSARQELYNEYPVEKFVSAKTPRTFIACATDDNKSDAENSIRFYLALKRAGVAAEMHIFQRGGVPPYLKNSQTSVKNWSNACIEWLKESGIIR